MDTSAKAEIFVVEEGGIKIHTLLAPEVSSGTATHIVETPESLVIVDTQLFRAYAKQFREYADSLGKPISHVFISHGHPDHYFGLEYFEDVPTFALADTRRSMRRRHEFHLKMHRETERECDAITDRVRFPATDVTLGEQMIGGVRFLLEDVEEGEDGHQLVVRVPAAKALILQDLMATNYHGYTANGMIAPWVRTLKGYAADTHYKHVLAGHGRPAHRDALDDMISYLHKSKALYKASESADEFTAALTQAYPNRKGAFLVKIMGVMHYEVLK